MIEWTHFAKQDGYMVMDEEKGQGNFLFFYEPSKKIVIYDVWKNKRGDLKMGFNKRVNTNANIIPSIVEEIIEAIWGLAGVEPDSPKFPKRKQKVSPRETAGVKIKKDIDNVGV